jgi:hypothetical protein
MIDVHGQYLLKRALLALILPGKNLVLPPDPFSPRCCNPRDFTLQDDQEIRYFLEYARS